MKIILEAPWSFHSIPRTIDYPAGEHEVDDEVYAAALAAGVTGKETGDDAHGDAKGGAARRSRTAQD